MLHPGGGATKVPIPQASLMVLTASSRRPGQWQGVEQMAMLDLAYLSFCLLHFLPSFCLLADQTKALSLGCRWLCKVGGAM